MIITIQNLADSKATLLEIATIQFPGEGAFLGVWYHQIKFSLGYIAK